MRISLSYFFYFILANGTATVVCLFYPYPQCLWLQVTAFFLSLAVPPILPFHRMMLTIATGLLTAAVMLVLVVMGEHSSLIAAILFLVTFVCVGEGIRKPDIFYLLCGVNVLVLVAGVAPVASIENSYQLFSVIGGGMLAAVYQVIFMPGFTQRESKTWAIKSLRQLGLVSEEIFACFLRPEYVDNLYLFERRLHFCKMRYFRAMTNWRDALTRSEKNKATDADLIKKRLIKVDFLFDILMDCAQLRRRVSDHTVFSLCADELAAISKEIKNVFAQLEWLTRGRIDDIDLSKLDDKIRLFEENFQVVLKVVAREPLAFLLFVASLKHFREEAQWYG